MPTYSEIHCISVMGSLSAVDTKEIELPPSTPCAFVIVYGGAYAVEKEREVGGRSR